MPATKQCRLLGGPPAWLAQVILALTAMLALVYKRHKERPQRPLDVWVCDVFKQVLSMLLAHTCGLVIASIVSEAGQRVVSDCAWYFVAFVFDTSLGVALTIGIHRFVLKAAENKAESSSLAATISNCGMYGNPPQWRYFWPQAVEWMIVTVIARMLCGSVVYIARAALVHIARILDILFAGHPIAMLYFVMICCPLLMNIFQAVLQDIALKRKQRQDSAGDWQDIQTDNAREMSEGPLLSPTEKANLHGHTKQIQMQSAVTPSKP